MKTKCTIHAFIALAALCLAAVATADAGITVDDTQSKVLGFQAPGLLWTAYDASGSDKLVVTVSGENKNNGASTVTGITYGGTPMTEAVQHGNTSAPGQAAIFYLDDPGAAGDIVVAWNNAQNGQIATLLALSGTAPGVGPTNGADATAVSLTTVVDESLVVAHHYVNQNILPTADAPMTELVSSRGANGYFGVSVGYQNVASAGAVTLSFTSGTTGPKSAAAAFEPAAIPPPSRFDLVITPNPTPGLYDFQWNSQPGKLYDLLASTDLSTPVDSWPVYDDGTLLHENIPATGASTTRTGVPSGDPRRFFAMREKDAVAP